MMDRFEQLTQFDFHHTLEETTGICLIFFSASACPSCHAWRGILAGYRARNPQVRVFEVDSAQDLALVREFSIFHLPALYLYRDGIFHCEIQTQASLAALAESVAEALTAPAHEIP